MRSTASLLGVMIDKVTMDEAVEKVKAFVMGDKAHSILTPNAEIIMAAQRDPELMEILNKADMVVADGAGVVLGSRILNLGLPEKVSGVDLARNSFSMPIGRKIKYYIYGGKPGVAELAAKNIIEAYKNAEISGYSHGYISQEEKKDLINKINSSGADILLVCLGAPLQERWIHENKDKLKVKVCMGIGGSVDIFAGTVKLAPEFLRRNGLEWLYRLYNEPRRFIRMLDLPRFVIRVLAVKLGIKK